MPIQKCQKDGKEGYKYGDTGTCYIGPNAKKKAEKQGIAIRISQMRELKVSFDFDGVLDTEKGFALAQEKTKEGNSVYIITARQEKTASEEVFKVAEELGIRRDRIHFTNGADKWKFVKELGIDIHYDNNKEQVDKINANTKAKGILI